MFPDNSYLQLFWMGQILFVGLVNCFLILTGTHLDIKGHNVQKKEKIGWLQFRKSLTQYHFVGLIWSLWILINVIYGQCFGSGYSSYYNDIMDWLVTPRAAATDSQSLLIATVLFVVQVARRLYESISVSIFSRRQVLNPISKVLQYIYFVAAGLSLVAEAPDYNQNDPCLSPMVFLRINVIVGVAIFIFASQIHHTSHKGLAKLRRNRFGHVTTTEYKMPKGGYFDLVSCPHYLSEILIYVSIGLILGTSCYTWWLLVGYVFINQVLLALDTHKFYNTKFEDYPKDRKMLIPFLL